MEDGYEDYWEAREVNKNFRKVNAELSKIIRALRDLRRQP
jgi:CHASE3 domain sensor protein